MNTAVLNIIRFVFFLAVQVLIFNNLNLLGYINPFPYLLYIVLFPVHGNKMILLVSSFLLGLTLDMFCNSGGIHTTASTLVAFIRPNLLRFSFGLSYEYQTIKITEKINSESIIFLLVTVLIHHFTMFLLEAFRFDLLFMVVVKTLLTSIATLLLCILIIYLIRENRK